MKRTVLLLLLIISLTRLIYSQTIITGTVTSSDDGMGIPGATIIVKGTVIGTTADIDGKYKIEVPQGAKTLIYSFVGMRQQELEINTQTMIDVVLKTDVFKMEEVVVSGVASATQKKNLTVSVVRVDSKELEDVPAMSAASALQGKVAGVTIINGSGNPGQSSSIQLRGTNSLFEAQAPLILMDGLMFQGELADINADDIESMEVVKGASASALYGSKAGSGVVVIHTKRGKLNEDGETEIKIRTEYGGSSLLKEIKMATHHPYMIGNDYQQKDYTKYYNVTYPNNYEGGVNKSIIGSRTLDYDQYADNPYSFVNDVQKSIFQSGNFITNHISISSTGKKTTFFASAEHNKNSGIVWNSKGSERINGLINIDHMVNDKFKLSTNVMFTENNIDKPGIGGQSSPFYNLLTMSPDVNLNLKTPSNYEIENKSYFAYVDPWSLGENPKHQLFHETSFQKRNDFLISIGANWNIARWINFDADYHIEKLFSKTTDILPKGYQSSSRIVPGYESKYDYNLTSQSLQATANLQEKFGNFVTKGKLSYIYEKFEDEHLFASGDSMLVSGITNMANLNNKKSFIIVSPSSKSIAYNYSGILDIGYKDKVNASLLYRLDGSSLFGPQSRWNSYYRASIAYRINEDLHIPGFQELKLRTSVGTSGQRPKFEYQYETYQIEPNKNLSLNATKGNKSLKPSDTKETEIGINAVFLENFEFEVVRSWSETKGIFCLSPLPASSGYTNQWANIASTLNNTWEMTFGAQLVKTKKFDWSINLTFDRVRQTVQDIGTLPYLEVGPAFNSTALFKVFKGSTFGIIEGNDWVRSLDQMKNQLPVGKSIDDYTLNSDGYVIVKGTEGRASFLSHGKLVGGERPIPLDQNNDGYADIVKIGDCNPDFNLSLFSKFNYKNFGLTMLWFWKQGGDVYNRTKQTMYFAETSGDIDQFGKPDFKKKSIEYYYALYSGGDSASADNLNKHFVEDGTFLKLRELALYCNFTNKSLNMLNKLNIKNLKISLIGRNLLTFSKYSGWDPESSAPDINGNISTSYIVDIYSYPNFRTYTASIEITF